MYAGELRELEPEEADLGLLSLSDTIRSYNEIPLAIHAFPLFLWVFMLAF